MDSTKLYAETPSKKLDDNSCSLDNFFCTFAKFFNYFSECYQMIWAEREKNERAKRQTLVRSIITKKSFKKKVAFFFFNLLNLGENINRTRKNEMNKDFESLVSALQSGELFSEDLSRLRTSIRYYNQSKTKPSNLLSLNETQNDKLITDTLNNITNTSKINLNTPQTKPNDNQFINNKKNSKMTTTPLCHQITTLVI